MIDETTHLESYNAHWREWFQDERQRLIQRIGEHTDKIEHFGSTSVPGMTAKPIIDLLVGVSAMHTAEDIIPLLESAGYEYLGEAGIPGRRYLRRRGEYDFNVHIMQHEGNLWNDNLLLRDSDEKHEFVRQLLDRAKDRAKVWSGKERDETKDS
ncbi:hypothetical protein JCM10914A_30480 [Paenibacillus sp. JCM 10914]|uniref:GrpB family protein n=1 Tax=Paenibacillus sp. JCM 10914 TaxID=1236974 RepID=UPI0003CC907C|nr:GrpB family protein [Paenibacillus sp. JCM 10914]GAE07185.1 glutamate-rich protein grpB [Paenibacillus sp. JCM 10914]